MAESSASVRPGDAGELREIVAAAAGRGRPLEIRAGGSKREIGNPERETTVVDLRSLGGVVAYEPSELILTVRPATLLSEVEAMLAAHGQMLAFEPWDHGALLGCGAGEATVGGIFAAGVSGPRRVSAGSARDHLLGFTAISGRGEEFKAGGKVVKNVTGYDVSKVMTGSWGQLAVLSELTLKVVPAPRTVTTVALTGLSAEAAIMAMSRAMGSPCAPAATAHLPAAAGTGAITAVRLEGFRESVEARATQLISALGEFGPGALMDEQAAADLWTAVREGRPVAAAETVWRAHVAPSRAAALAGALEASGATWFYDWAGALIWIGAPAAVDVRATTDAHDGHVMLLRAPIDVRQRTSARPVEPAGVAALTARIKRAFDPAGILDPQRFG
jgi:glycolate oxidase FAD binding subunit